MMKLYNKNTIKNLFWILMLSFSVKTVGQISNSPNKFLPNIIPPSPTAYHLGKYGNVPVGMFTGSPNLNIPIYTYKTTNLEVPITMFYGSNGIKVDEISSNVGQGWNLSFGGVISRVVRDLPDESRGANFIPLNTNSTSTDVDSFCKSIADYDDIDSEVDLFSFNVGNYSGKFVLDNDNSIVLMPAQNIKIEKQIENDYFNFVMTTPDGIKYYFNDREVTFLPKESGGRPFPVISTSAWYLTKIVHPKGDEIYFNYFNKNDRYITSKSQTLTIQYPTIQYTCEGMVSMLPELSTIFEHRINVSGKAIKSISSNNGINGEITFNYLDNNSADVDFGNNKISEIVITKNKIDVLEKVKFIYTTTQNKRVFLDKIQYNDLAKNYQFEYLEKEKFPDRLSLSQDHWGYYNGANNSCLVPNKTGLDTDNIDYKGADKEPNGNFAKLGMLNKIIYPTKGSSSFEYESNDYYGDKIISPNLTNCSLDIFIDGASTKEIIITSLSKQVIELNANVLFYDQCAESDYGKTQAFIRAKNINTGSYEYFNVKLYNGELSKIENTIQISPNNGRKVYLIAEANQTYIISLALGNFSQLTEVRSCTSASLRFSYLASAPYTIKTNLITGGIRIKNTKDYSNNNSTPIYKRYFYATKKELSKSSGVEGNNPLYIDDSSVIVQIDCPNAGNYYTTVSYLRTYKNATSSSITSLFGNGNSNISYENVTISNGDDNFINGGEEHEFYIDKSIQGSQIVGKYRMLSSPSSYGLLMNGLPKTISFFNNYGKTIKTTINSYEDKLLKVSKSYSTRKYFNNEGVIDYFEDIQDNIGVIEYYNSSYWSYLKSMTDSLFDLNGLNPITTTTNYNYTSPRHLQITSQSTTSSIGEPLETKYYYPPDLLALGIQTSEMQKLTDQNRINLPLKTETFVNNVQTSENNTKYEESTATGNLLLPKEIHEIKGLGDIDLTTITNRKIIFTLYDTDRINGLPKGNGNILEYKLESGTPVSIIWGYNKTQPIAKIENAAYSEISSYVDNLQTISNTGTEANLLTALSVLRNALPNAMITTYTYKTLIGISSITDPKGDTTFYEYDEFNRIKLTKDTQGNVLSENQYHYKN
ncbi:RHS repeat protein [Flavobacterium sp. ZT3R18]|uniref:RHS repeat protein n=1 Tax=Flavobacterium sp. ZT3R18 TaxID=2594429 RepID=UPI001179E136|nr:RHS repeat protein [Flavobacterium sp. ZT3R18]TRX34057.1 RHS repeat protein [Flavobacterium sp. ZT3R18]